MLTRVLLAQPTGGATLSGSAFYKEPPMKLQDQRVLVTGSTAGIGRETAMLFARRGATVVITGRDTQRGAQSVAAIVAEGGRAEFIAADLNEIESVRRPAGQGR